MNKEENNLKKDKYKKLNLIGKRQKEKIYKFNRFKNRLKQKFKKDKQNIIIKLRNKINVKKDYNQNIKNRKKNK